MEIFANGFPAAHQRRSGEGGVFIPHLEGLGIEGFFVLFFSPYFTQPTAVIKETRLIS